MDHNKEMKRLLYKNTRLFYFSRKGLKLSVSVKEETGRRRQTEESEDCYIDPYLLTCVVPHSKPYLALPQLLSPDALGPLPPLVTSGAQRS